MQENPSRKESCVMKTIHHKCQQQLLCTFTSDYNQCLEMQKNMTQGIVHLMVQTEITLLGIGWIVINYFSDPLYFHGALPAD